MRKQYWTDGLTLAQQKAISAAANRGDMEEARRLMEAAGKTWQEQLPRKEWEKRKWVRI